MCAASFQRLSSPAPRWRHSSDLPQTGPLGARRRRTHIRRHRRRSDPDERSHRPAGRRRDARPRDRVGLHRRGPLHLGAPARQQPRLADGRHRLRLVRGGAQRLRRPGPVQHRRVLRIALRRYDDPHAARRSAGDAGAERSPHRQVGLPAGHSRDPAAVRLLRPVPRLRELSRQRLHDHGQPDRGEHRGDGGQPDRRRHPRSGAPQPRAALASRHASRAAPLRPHVRRGRGADDRADRPARPPVDLPAGERDRGRLRHLSGPVRAGALPVPALVPACPAARGRRRDRSDEAPERDAARGPPARRAR